MTVTTARKGGRRQCLLFVLLAVLASVGLVTVGAQPANAAAESGAYGSVQLNAGDWMTANGNGVTVYSNGDTTTVSNDYSAPAVGMKWQCVELAQRLYQAKGWTSGTWGVNAYGIYGLSGFQSHPNDGTYMPVPGDMIIHGTSDPGHVAVVDRISGSTLYAVEQNVATSGQSSPGRATYTLTNGVLSRDQALVGLPIKGIVHSPNNPYTNGRSATLTPNLYLALHNNTPSGMTEVKVLNAATSYTSWIGGWVTADGWHSGSDVSYLSGDYDGDGTPDVFVIQHNNTPSGKTEVKVLSGATQYSTWIGGWVTPDGWHSGSDVDYAVGDWDHDGKPDIFVIQHNNTPSGMTEVKVLSGASQYTSWIGGWVTADGLHSGSDVNYAVADYDNNNTLDVYEVLHNNTASGKTEVKVLNGSTTFSSWIGGWVTPDGWHSGSDADYAVADFNQDNKPDVYVVLHNNTASGMTEVKILDAASQFSTWIGGWVTPDGWHSGNDADYALPR